MATVKFYTKNPKVKGKLRSDEVSIYAKVTKDGSNRFELRTGEKIEPKYWDFKGQQVKSTYRGYLEINAVLQDFKLNILKLYRDNQTIPFSQFKALAQNTQEKKTLFLAFDQFLAQYQAEKDIKTFRKYNALLRQLKEFDRVHDIDFLNLDFRFYDKFKEHLYAIPNPNYRKQSLVYHRDTNDYTLSMGAGDAVGLFDDTVYKYIINLKTFLRWAEKREYSVIPSFKSWEIIRRKHEPISLTKAELSKIQNHTFEWKSQDIARDYLVLQCLTGQRISDIKRFNLKDYSDLKWTFIQKKGNRLQTKEVTVHFKGFCAPALDILEKYNWQIPSLSEVKINKHIKIACRLAGIDSPMETIRWAQNKKIRISGLKYEWISNHTGRKTFITLALQEGLSIEYVMQLTGISEYDTIKHYKGKFEDSAIERALEKIPRTLMRKAL